MPVIDDPLGLMNSLQALASLKERKGEPEWQVTLIRNAATYIEEQLESAGIPTKEAPTGETYIVAMGHVFDGMSFHGPFVNYDVAELFASREEADTYIVRLEDPEE